MRLGVPAVSLHFGVDAALTHRRPLKVNLLQSVGQQGAEPQLVFVMRVCVLGRPLPQGLRPGIEPRRGPLLG